MKIEEATSSTVAKLWTEVEPRIEQAGFLEEAAQTLAAALHQRFAESVVIARVFLTVPFSELPGTNAAFVRNLVETADPAAELKPTTPVLSLVGTHGQKEDWCDRRKSKGHVGIPLISSAFVGAIPMIARLLRELEVPLDWIDSHDSEMLIETIGHSAGLFFVEDAAETKDQEGRSIIAAQDFVSEYGVKSVFGVGRAYDSGQMVVVVVFCRDRFSRDSAECFLDLGNRFHSKTTSLVERGAIFAAA